MGFFSSSKPKEPPKPTQEDLNKAAKEAYYKQYLIDFENSKKILTATVDLKRDYEIIGVVFGYYVSARETDKIKEDERNPIKDIKFRAYKLGADAVIGIRQYSYGQNGYTEMYGTAIKFL